MSGLELSIDKMRRDGMGDAAVDAFADAYERLRDTPYDDAALERWAATIRDLLDEGLDVYCYFKHEDEPTAPAYAARLRELVTG